MVPPPLELPGDGDDGQLVPDHDHPVQMGAATAGQVQALAQRPPQRDVGQRGDRQRDDDVTAGQPDVEGVGDDGQGRGQRQAGAQHPLVFVGTDKKEPPLVGPGERERADETQWQQRGQQDVVPVVRRDVVAEPHVEGQRAGGEPDGEVGDEQDHQVPDVPGEQAPPDPHQGAGRNRVDR